MNKLQVSKQFAKISCLYVGLAVALIVALPLLAGLAYAVRFLIPLMVVGALVALGFSPAVRRWFAQGSDEADNAVDYKGVRLPTSSLESHPAHSWVKVDSGLAQVGIDDLVLTALGKVSSIEAPAVGTKVQQGDTLFTVGNGRRRLQVKAPLGGVVAAVHSEALGDPAALAGSPYGKGWVVRLQDLSSERPVALLEGAALAAWFRSEVDRLLTILSSNGPARAATMADGGRIAPDLADRIDDGKWAELADQLFANPRV